MFLISEIIYIHFDAIVTLQYNKMKQSNRGSGPWKESVEWEYQSWLRKKDERVNHHSLYLTSSNKLLD